MAKSFIIPKHTHSSSSINDQSSRGVQMGTLLSSFPLITYTQFIKYQGSVIKGGSNGNIVILLPSNNIHTVHQVSRISHQGGFKWEHCYPTSL